MAELATVCAVHYTQCLEFLAAANPPEPEPEPDDYCAPVYLGPDIGFANIMEYHDNDGSCTISMSELASTCSVFFAQCIAFLQSSETPAPEPEPAVTYFTAAGWVLMPANSSVVATTGSNMALAALIAQPGSNEEVEFVYFLRDGLAQALGIPIDMVSVTEINGTSGNGRVHVRFELTAASTEAAAIALLQDLINQSTNPTSALMQGSLTNAIEQVVATVNELQLHTCPPVFLGPNIGFVNVMEYHDNDGSCTLSMSELASVCSTEILRVLARHEPARLSLSYNSRRALASIIVACANLVSMIRHCSRNLPSRCSIVSASERPPTVRQTGQT